MIRNNKKVFTARIWRSSLRISRSFGSQPQAAAVRSLRNCWIITPAIPTTFEL